MLVPRYAHFPCSAGFSIFSILFSLSISPSPELAKATQRDKLESCRAATPLDVWALGASLVELFIRRHFMRSDRPENMEALRSFSEIAVPESQIGDPQAVHLLQKILRKNPLDRANVVTILVSP